jgi:hypothetical protein
VSNVTCVTEWMNKWTTENQNKLSTETGVLLDDTKETVLKLKMDIAKHSLHEMDTKLKSA